MLKRVTIFLLLICLVIGWVAFVWHTANYLYELGNNIQEIRRENTYE